MLDVLTIGRVGVDIYPLQIATPLAEVETFGKFLGGCEIFPPDHFPLWFYRTPTSPDLQIRPAELDVDAIAAAGVFWLTGTGLCQQPSRDAHAAALAARGATAGPARRSTRGCRWRSRL